MKWASCSGAKSKRFSHPDVAAVAIPLAHWADEQIRSFAAITATSEMERLTGSILLSERATLNGYRIPGRVSAGGGCRIFETRDGHIALNLSRPDDRASLPALFRDETATDGDDTLTERFRNGETSTLLAQGRALGLAIALLDESAASPACIREVEGTPARSDGSPGRPLIVDLSALWAGPLAARLLNLAGAEVIKVESRNRPDAMRLGDPQFFKRLNRGKTALALDLREPADRETLLSLIRRADIVIEAARPRALRQLGIDADAMVRAVPGLVWATITGHGIAGEAADWIGFGDDCGVAGGLSAALFEATGTVGFVGDAIADPLTGIFAARSIAQQRVAGRGAHLVLSMSGVVAEALASERARDEAALSCALERWAEAEGQAFPSC